MKARVLAVSVLSLAMLFATYQTVSAQSSGGCARVGTSIVTGTATVAPGTMISIGGSVNNCSSRKARYTVVVSAMSSCGQKADIASSRMALNPAENKMYVVSYTLPSTTCTGPWDASVQVRDNGGILATASTTITIE